MIAENKQGNGPSRRRFLAAAGAAALASGLQMRKALAQPPSANFHRLNLSNPKAAPALESYRKAITAMLNLPPTDPRNWYRNALIHTLDCPHGNWWFLPWHRGYIGWFEQTCRQLSGDANFALPYWDWTAEPELPASFSGDNVLNPANAAYIASGDAFQAEFTDPINAFYEGLSMDQLGQLNIRPGADMPLDTAAALWNHIQQDGLFFDNTQARQPNFDQSFFSAVSITTIKAAIAPADFITFGSSKADVHSNAVGEGVLESQPHDNVHNAVSGFMSNYLSPVDPLFFMHHSNIDRLWDVWTRKQQRQSLPTLPTGADLAAWTKEPFLFYIDSAGQSVKKTQAGDYSTIGDFNYDYQPGSGEEFIPTTPRPSAFSKKIFAAVLSRKTLDFREATHGTVPVPQELHQAITARGGPELVARIALQPPAHPRGVLYYVLVNPPVGARNVRFDDPSFAGTISLFGSHGGDHNQPVSFLIPLNATMAKLRKANRLKADEQLRIRVVPATKGVTLTPFESPLAAISVEAL